MPKKKRGLPKHKTTRHNLHFVDELFNRDDAPIGRMLPLASLEVNPDQPRDNLGDLKDLVNSIKMHGVLEPLLVKSLGNGKYRIISGERRYHAAVEAGLEQVPCIEWLVEDDAQMVELALVENLLRKDLDPFEEATGYHFLKEKFNYSDEKIARALGKARSTITETLSLLKMPEEIRKLCMHAGITAKSILVEIARAENLMEMRRLVDLYATGGNRTMLRKKRKGEKGEDKPKPFVFKVSSKESGFSMQIKFKKEKVEKEEIIQVLQNIIEELKSKNLT